jgi:hypothetical protein
LAPPWAEKLYQNTAPASYRGAQETTAIYKLAPADVQKTQGVLPDTPTEPFPDPYLMEGDMLSRRGRTGAYG